MSDHPLPSNEFVVRYFQDSSIEAVSNKAHQIAADTRNKVISVKEMKIPFTGNTVYLLIFAYTYVNIMGDMFDLEHNQGEITTSLYSEKIVGYCSALDDITNTSQLVDRIKMPATGKNSLTWLVTSSSTNLDFLDELRKAKWYVVPDLRSLKMVATLQESVDHINGKDCFIVCSIRCLIVDITGVDTTQNDQICKYLETIIVGRCPNYKDITTIQPMNVLVIADWLPTVPEDVDHCMWGYMKSTSDDKLILV